MRRLAEGVLLAAGMVAVILFIEPADAQREGGSSRPEVVHMSARDITDFEGVDVESSGGKVVGVTVVRKGGRQALRRLTQEPCEAGCPAGENLSCWQGESGELSLCVCDGGATAARKFSGGKKYSNIVLKRGADTSHQ
jgi:hypothetical protein